MVSGKPQRKLSFCDSDSLKTNHKGSLFEKLFPLRKGLFEKFPSANKGLALSGPGIKVGDSGSFTFSCNEKTDKLDYKGDDGVNVCARYKKDAKLFDVSVTGKCCGTGFSYLLKYEERGDAAPHYIVGGEYKDKKHDLHTTYKFNPLTTRAKISVLQEGGHFGLPSGLRIAADTKLFLNQVAKPEHILFNIGAAYKNPLGQTGVSYNQNGLLTLTHIKQIDDFQVGFECVQAIHGPSKKTGPKMPLVVAANYQVDKTTLVRAKLNKDLFLNVGVKKDFSKNLCLTAGTSWELRNLSLQVPAFGFKVNMKG